MKYWKETEIKCQSPFEAGDFEVKIKIMPLLKAQTQGSELILASRQSAHRWW